MKYTLYNSTTNEAVLFNSKSELSKDELRCVYKCTKSYMEPRWLKSDSISMYVGVSKKCDYLFIDEDFIDIMEYY